MITKSEFEILLLKPESTTLDFKRTQYEIIKEGDKSNTAKLIKDIICFCNTIRTETAYIIIGIDIKDDGSKNLVGLNENIDDSIFQNKVKGKVSPSPIFSYYTFAFADKKFGILEFPVKKYLEPLSSTINMNGLEAGKIYFRRGSSNSEAFGREVITINNWFGNMPNESIGLSFTDEIHQLLSRITSTKYPLSENIAQALHLSETYNLHELKEFCKNELTGWFNKVSEDDIPKILSYRVNEVIVSPYEIEINPYAAANSIAVMNELKKTKGFFTRRILFAQPISEIEKNLKRLNENPNNTIMTRKISGDKIINEKITIPQLILYANRDNLDNVYSGIRQKLIDILVAIK
jgi:hypothetical protein